MSRTLALAIALSMSATFCFAQVEPGAITGNIADASGASVPRAKVKATNQETGVVVTTETTDDGYYKLPYLPAGKYNVSVEKAGFSTSSVKDVPVLVGQSATVNVALKTG